MSHKLWISTFGAIVLFAGNALAQTPPAGSTGLCKDGTYSNAPKKAGACSGHKGVQTWYSEAAAKPVPAAASVPAAKPAPAPAPVAAKPAPAPAPAPAPVAAKPSATGKSSPANMQQAPGGGPGMVWVNTASKVYHCSGTTYYGKTKVGKYMTEAAAKAEGDRADAGKACTK